MILSWERPSSDGGSPLSGYIIEKKERNSLLWVRANESVVKATQYTCTGLMEGLEYSFRVSALNQAGQGKPCKQTDFITARTAVGTSHSTPHRLQAGKGLFPGDVRKSPGELVIDAPGH